MANNGAVAFARRVEESFQGRVFPAISLREVSTDSPYVLKTDGCSLLILISKNYDCNPCTIRELRNLDSLFWLLNRQVKVHAVFLGADRAYPLMVRKVSQAQFPFLYTNDTLLERFNKHQRFPLIFLLKGRTVEETLFPIPTNELYSREWFLRQHSRLRTGC